LLIFVKEHISIPPSPNSGFCSIFSCLKKLELQFLANAKIMFVSLVNLEAYKVCWDKMVPIILLFKELGPNAKVTQIK